MKYDFVGAFLENSLSKQNFPFPHMLAVCMQGEGEGLSFFLKLAALCMVLLRRFKILLGARSEGSKRSPLTSHALPGLLVLSRGFEGFFPPESPLCKAKWALGYPPLVPTL